MWGTPTTPPYLATDTGKMSRNNVCKEERKIRDKKTPTSGSFFNKGQLSSWHSRTSLENTNNHINGNEGNEIREKLDEKVDISTSHWEDRSSSSSYIRSRYGNCTTRSNSHSSIHITNKSNSTRNSSTCYCTILKNSRLERHTVKVKK